MLALLAEMRRKQLEANVITFSAACSACEKGLRWAEAGVLRRCRGRHGATEVLELLREMRNSGLQPNVRHSEALPQGL